MKFPNVPGRTVFNAQEATLEEVREDGKPGERIRCIVAFASMHNTDPPKHMAILNEAWRSNLPGRKNLGANLEQAFSYYENFGDLGLSALLLDSEDSEKYELVGGIWAMRTNMVPRVRGIEPDIWTPDFSNELMPPTWDELTNGCYFDTKRLHGNWKRIWPVLKGKVIVCPTVFIRKKIWFKGRWWRISPQMKGMIAGVKNRGKIMVLDGKSSLLVAAHSTPSSKYKHPNLMINDYLQSSHPNKEMQIENMICEKDSIGGEERQKRMYEAYRRCGGTAPFESFVADSIAEFSIMEEGTAAFLSFCNERRPILMDEFVRLTRRPHFDPVLGQHMYCGARIGKVIPNSRVDAEAENYNVQMLYWVIRYADALREENERKMKEEKEKRADAL